MELKDQLNKMLSDYSNLNKSNESLFESTVKDIDNLKDKSQAEFLKKSVLEAKSGKLNINSFLGEINKLKNVD